MKRLLLLLVFPTRVAVAGDAAPAEQIKAAVQKLASAPNYSWVVSTAAEEKSHFTPGPVEGRTESGGLTHWTMSFGDRKVEAWIKGSRVALKSGDTWVKPEEPEAKAPAPPHGEGRPPAPPPGDQKPHGDKSRSDGRRTAFLARRFQEMKTPAEFAADLAGKLTTLTGSGGEFSGELSPAAAIELLTFGHHGKNRDGQGPPEPSNPRGTVKFAIKDGQLAGMEIRLAATISFKGCEVKIDRTTNIVIKDAGTTTLDPPAAARALLEPPPA